MKDFRELWRRMSKDVCSSDEAVTYSNKMTCYEILTPGWRNPQIKAWFQAWDHLCMSLRFGSDGKPNGPGRFPHIRIEPVSKRLDPHAKAPSKLPLNFYDPVWYRSLDQIECQKLDAKPEIDLTFPVEAIR